MNKNVSIETLYTYIGYCNKTYSCEFMSEFMSDFIVFRNRAIYSQDGQSTPLTFIYLSTASSILPLPPKPQ